MLCYLCDWVWLDVCLLWAERILFLRMDGCLLESVFWMVISLMVEKGELLVNKPHFPCRYSFSVHLWKVQAVILVLCSSISMGNIGVVGLKFLMISIFSCSQFKCLAVLLTLFLRRREKKGGKKVAYLQLNKSWWLIFFFSWNSLCPRPPWQMVS